jgi:hypothetical protein
MKGRGELFSLGIGKDCIYISPHSNAGFKFELICLKVNTGDELWRTDVRATDRLVLLGRGHHNVYISEQDGGVVVFGAESHGLYVEKFEKSSGKRLFRFCTADMK